MSARLQIETSLLGDQGADPRDQRIAELERELRGARREANDASLDAVRAKEDASRALSMLRSQLSPLYRALQAVFGELDTAGIRDAVAGESSGPAVNDATAVIWDEWKRKLSPGCGRVIDALRIHKDMNSTQVCIAAHVSQGSISSIILKLNKAGLINKNGGRFSLKQL